ncbi:MAG: NAD-dependent deacylase [Bacteroidetes bacterium]|nr:MAG: NAD-dependent deacylase [Bacteroidota bacterium]
MGKKKIVVFTGAGISAESGLKTFRDSGGLWEEYKVEEVATPEAWEKDPELVLTFYNKRLKQVMNAKPNAAHYAIVELEKKFDVQILTQNIDDLHERAGSKKVLHLHGEITKCRSSSDDSLIYNVKNGQIRQGEKCEKGSQLRPHIVWFGEYVPHMDTAAKIAAAAEIFIIIGTSMNVYPAAGLVDLVPSNAPKYLIDPQAVTKDYIQNIVVKRERAGTAVPELVKNLLK